AANRFRAARSPFSASVRFGGTMSRRRAWMPALARWAAMPLPMTPAPITPTRRIGFVMQKTSRLGVGRYSFSGPPQCASLFAGDPPRRARTAPRAREFCVAVALGRALGSIEDDLYRSLRIGHL